MAARTSSFAIPKSCKHLADFKLRHGLSGYIQLQNRLRTNPNGKTTVQIENAQTFRCDFCCGYRGRLYICLLCSSISCCLFPDSNHVHLHSQSEIGHDIAVDVERAELYCCVCCDQVYDPDFDKIVMLKHSLDIEIRGRNGVETRREKVKSDSKRRKVRSWIEFDLMQSKSLVLRRDPRSKTVYPLGLRGLNNLGSTCFMNSVLQALLHAPPLRNYFLGDRYNRQCCPKRSVDRLCLPCDIDELFSAVFSGDRTPYTPAQFLYSWWMLSENLATYEQQDAHEFFISMLDHMHEKEAQKMKPTKDIRHCECIAHRVFSGLLRSDVTCTVCGSTSTTYDPCIDISLDLDTHNSSRVYVTDKSSQLNSGTETLSSCLDHFTRPEKLGSDQKLYCERCRERRDSLKQMSISQLPLVLCLHIKRFEHSPARKLSRKLDHYLQFPFCLDMRPYLSSSVLRSRHGNRIFMFEYDEVDMLTEYEIFAVVTHSGTLESGHYVTYLRLNNQWYKCDDAWVTEVHEGTVRASQCYMIYYVQKMFYHKTSEDLSCLPLSLRKDAFLPIAGCC